MTFLFQNLLLAWLAPLVGVPVLLHFLAKARPPRYLFSATELLKKVVQQTLRVKKPKDRLLLVCRTLLCAALVMIFLRPVIFTQDYTLNPNLPRNLALIVDRSASMAWTEGGQSRYKTACNEAAEILGGLSSSDKANIIWIDKDPDSVFPELGSNIHFLQNALKTARVTHESGNVSQAIQLALTQLGQQGENRELCIISDFQATQWQGIGIQIPEDITVSTIQHANTIAENGTILSLGTNPVSPLVGESAQVICSLGNFSNTPRSRTVTLEIGEKRITRQISLPAWGQGSVAVEHVFSEHGRIPVSARLDEDLFGADDWRGIHVQVRSTLKIGVMGNDSNVLPVWNRALEALPWVQKVKINEDGFSNDETYDLLMVAGWSGDHADTLARLRERDIPIILSPAPGLSWKNITLLAGLPDKQVISNIFQETLDSPMGMQIIDNTHPVFSLFRDGSFGDPAGGTFTRRLCMPKDNTSGKTILAFTDGQPALSQVADAPAFILWMALLSQENSDWTSKVAFLPFFGELIQTFRSHTTDIPPESALPGDILSFEISTTFEQCHLSHGDDEEIPVSRMDSPQGIRFVSEPVKNPGIYKWCIGKKCPEFRMVNFPVAESDLRVSTPPAISKGPVHSASHATELNRARDGIQLWKILVWVILCIILVESVLVVLMAIEERKISEGQL